MKIKKGLMVFGFLIALGTPFLSVPLFIFGSEIEKALSVPAGYSGVAFVAGMALAIGGGLLGTAIILGSVLVPLFSTMRSQSRVLSEGTAAEATILAVTDTGTRINHNPLVNFSLEVRSPTQQPFTANVSQTVSVIHLPSYQPGTELNVKYIPGTNEVAIVGLKTMQT